MADRVLTCKILRLIPERHMVHMIMELVANHSFTLTTGNSKWSRLQLGWSEFSKLCNRNFGVVYKVGNMAETNFKIDIRWLAPKTCLLPHPWGHVRVKFHECVITQLLGEIEN